MASRSPACLKSRGQNTVSSLQTNRPSLACFRRSYCSGVWITPKLTEKLFFWGVFSQKWWEKYFFHQTKGNYWHSSWNLKTKTEILRLPQVWSQAPSSSSVPVARRRNGRIRLFQCQVGKVMLDQFTRSYAQTLDSQLISLYRSPTPAQPGRENNNLGRSSPQH